jgi:anti-sigma factor RsiW
MAEHLPSQMIERFLARRLAPHELLAAARHLAACDACRARIKGARGTASAIHRLQADLEAEFLEQTHLDYAQLAAYVDASLNPSEREAINQHLAACVICATEVRELAALKNNLASYPHPATEKAAEAAAVPSPSPAKDSPPPANQARQAGRLSSSSWLTVIRLLRQKPLHLALATVVTVAAIVAASFLALRSNRPPQSVAETRPPTNSSIESARNPADQGKQNETIAQSPKDPSANANRHDPQTNQPNATGKPDQSVKEAESLASGLQLSPSYDKVIQQTLAAQTIALPEVTRQLIGKRSNLMSGKEESESFTVLNPVGTVIQNDRPTFRWQALSGATSYTVFVLDANFNVITKSQPLTHTFWTAPAALKRGGFYAWQVTARRSDGEVTAPAAPQPEARFKILEAAKLNELQRLAKARTDAHLILGILYAHNGLLDEAEGELQMAVDQHQEADTARKLLQSVKAMRH